MDSTTVFKSALYQIVGDKKKKINPVSLKIKFLCNNLSLLRQPKPQSYWFNHQIEYICFGNSYIKQLTAT